MNYRKTIAILTLGLAVTGLAIQGPAGAADDTKGAKIKAAIKKAIDAKKKDGPKKKDDQNTEAKPVPAIVDPPNAPAHPMPTASLAQLIDDGIRERLAAEKIQPSAASTDAEFVRRTFLDITGVIPTADRAAAFLDDRSADKRSKLIDELLESKNFGKRQADIWTALMYPVDSDNRFVGKAPLREWLTDQFNGNVHWDRLAFDLITATGEQEKNGASTYAMANRGVDKMTDSLGKLFLGVQIQCAQCHNHPFTHWKQTEYWGLAQFFYKVDVSNPRLAKDGGAITVSESNRPNRRANPLPESSKSVPAQLLGGDTIKLDSAKPYRPVLAQWVAAPANPFFAKAFVNRLWSQYFGRGFVNPIDDLSDENEPSHPELLKSLAKEFADSGFDIKHIVRGICNSEAYQRTSKPLGDNRDDRTLFSHQAMKVLTPEQLFDSLTAVLGPIGGGGGPMRKLPLKGQNRDPRDQFAQFFMGSDNARPTDYEAGIPQALRLMNNPLMATGRLANVAATVGGLSKGTAPAKVIEKLYLTTLARRPTAAEAAKVAEAVAKQPDAKSAYGDILWALLNSSEFALNR